MARYTNMIPKYSKMAGFTADEIAEAAGCKRATVYNWAKGEGKRTALAIEAAIETLIQKQSQNNTHETQTASTTQNGSV